MDYGHSFPVVVVTLGPGESASATNKGEDEQEFPPPMPVSIAATWLDRNNPYQEGSQDWYLYAVRFWINQAEVERRRSVWISRIALGLVVLGACAEVAGLIIGLYGQTL